MGWYSTLDSFHGRQSKGSFKGIFYGAYNKHRIDDIKDDLDEGLEQNNRMSEENEWGWDGIERDWRCNLWMLEEAEMEDINDVVNPYIEKFIIGSDRPNGFEKEDFRRAIACYTEMKIFPEEHFESEENQDKYYSLKGANIKGIVDKFVKKAVPIITSKNNNAEIRTIEDLTEKEQPFYSLDDEDKWPSVRIERGNRAISISVDHGLGNEERIEIREEEKSKSGEYNVFKIKLDTYKMNDSHEYVQIGSRNQKVVQKDMENGTFQEYTEITEKGEHGTISSKNRCAVHYEKKFGETKRVVDSIIEEDKKVVSDKPVDFFKENEMKNDVGEM